ncbi:MAG: choice-of-anchor M domain-containing protein [Corynebacterium pyruviciproducens]|uniref:choice-of-anchor M domain-containing protein n=1 Tax=Corynebacterium pyruviciproducens TaxID=598660 RepID=UPI00398357BF
MGVFMHATAFARALGFLLLAVVSCAGFSTATADPVPEKTVISAGHTDSPKVFWDAGARTFSLRTENGLLEQPVPIEHTISWLTADSTWTVPDEEAYASFGAPGDTFYASPENVGRDWDTKLWQGIGADAGLPVETFRDAAVALDLIDFSGPGEMTMFQDRVNPGESPVIFLSSARPGRQWTPLTAGSHTHLNTIFTAPGVYHLTYRATARLLTGELVASAPQETTWWVGPRPTGDTPGDSRDWRNRPVLTPHELGNLVYHVENSMHEGYHEITVTGEEPVHVTGGVYETADDAYPTCEFDYVATPAEPAQRYSDYCTEGVIKATLTPHPLVTGASAHTVSLPAGNGAGEVSLAGDGGAGEADSPAPETPASGEITAGHVDIGPVEENGSVVMRVMDKNHTAYAPSETVLVVNESARKARRGAAMMQPAFDFLGPEGTEFFLLEQSGAHQNRLIWPGFSTEYLPLELRKQGWDVEVQRVGNTEWTGFLTRLTGPERILPGTLNNVGHLHLNWAFMGTGDHQIKVRAVNRTTGQATAWEEVRFRVEGNAATPGASASTTPTTPTAPSTSTPAPPADGKGAGEPRPLDGARVRMEHGHADLAFKGSEAYFDISGSGGADGRRESGTVTFVVPKGVIPFSQESGSPWVGFSWSPVGGTVRLAQFSGPGTMTAFTPDSFGGRAVHLDSDDLGKTMELEGTSGHRHTAFMFSAPGEYTAVFAFTGTDGTRLSLTAHFDVREAAVEHSAGTKTAGTMPTTPHTVPPAAAKQKGDAGRAPAATARGDQEEPAPQARARASQKPGSSTATRAGTRTAAKKQATQPAVAQQQDSTPRHTTAPLVGAGTNAIRALDAQPPQQADGASWASGVVTGVGGACLVFGLGLLGVAFARRRNTARA